MIKGFYRSWNLYTTGQLVDGLQQKKENRFLLNGNGINVVFSRATILSFHPVFNHLEIFFSLSTGSLLVACAHFDAYVMGADLDYLLLHGKG